MSQCMATWFLVVLACMDAFTYIQAARWLTVNQKSHKRKGVYFFSLLAYEKKNILLNLIYHALGFVSCTENPFYISVRLCKGLSLRFFLLIQFVKICGTDTFLKA